MKQLYRLLIFCTVFLLLALPYAAVAQEDETYSEGLNLIIHRNAPTEGLIGMRLLTEKEVSGDWRESQVSLLTSFWDASGQWHSVNTTFVVPEDADWLEVSDDLGWSGLDTQVWVPLETPICPEDGGDCTYLTEMVLAEFHIAGWASDPVEQIDGTFRRTAVFTGAVTIDGQSLSIDGTIGSNFSNLYSEEDWP